MNKKSISLRFSDIKLEQEFRRFYDVETRPTIRLGSILSNIVLISFLTLTILFIPERFNTWLMLCVIVCLFLLFIVYATYNENYVGKIQYLASFQNIIFGFLCIYYCEGLKPILSNELADTILLVLLFGCLLYCFYIFRLRLVLGFFTSIVYLVFYQIHILDILNSTLIVFLTIPVWLVAGIVYFAAYIQEQTSRTVFLQQKEINRQRELLRIEGEKSEKLLHNIIPETIADRLKSSPEKIADGFNATTILFSDIVGFTPYSKTVSPEELVSVLNEIFSIFDTLTDKYGLEKIKTIGDAYMVAGGIPSPRDDHAGAIANMALDMQSELEKFNGQNGHTFQIRTGIHSGEAVAGVIGIKKFIYDLWGDTVNTASRMESHGLPGEIQVSEQTYELLKDSFVFDERGEIDVKGKGMMKTYLLKGRL